MRIVAEPFLRDLAEHYPRASEWLATWRDTARAAEWKNLIDVRQAYPHADGVKVKSKRTVTIFNVCGNDFRLITAIHFNRQIVFALRFLTHAEYSKGAWKNEL